MSCKNDLADMKNLQLWLKRVEIYSSKRRKIKNFLNKIKNKISITKPTCLDIKQESGPISTNKPT